MRSECEWFVFQHKMEYLPIKDVHFTSAIYGEEKQDERIDSVSQNHECSKEGLQ